jgi:hypothetical protein
VQQPGTEHLPERLKRHAPDFWLARGAVALVALLQLLVVNDLAVGPRWLAPSLELGLLIPLSIATAWTLGTARRAQADGQLALLRRQRRYVRLAALILTALISAMNCGALVQLVRALFSGHAGTGQTLLLDALNIWTTNVISFALWFWNIDRGGPAVRGIVAAKHPDFLFTQQTIDDESCRDWSPGFVDYLFLAFTNATAFSPADTFPLTQRAKLLMMAESSISFLTVALVASRAVGILN